jgi:trans-aconitate 2-methyltransferase
MKRPDLIYANAALQWVPDHETLIPRLFAALAPGGVLAIQMPDNRAEPTHRLMREVAPKRRGKKPSATPTGCALRCLAWAVTTTCWRRDAAHVDVWHTIYQHRWRRPRPSSNG